MVRNDRDTIWSLGKVARTVVPNPEFAFYGETASVPLHQPGRQPQVDTHYPTGVRACGVERREPFQDGRGNCSAAMPTPVSRTITDSPSDASTVTTISPCRVNLTALDKRTETSRHRVAR